MSHLILGFSMLFLYASPPAPAVCPNIDSGAARISVATAPIPLNGSFFIGRTWSGPKTKMWLNFQGQKPRQATCILDCTEYCWEYANQYCRANCQPNDYDCLQQCNVVQSQCNCDNHCCDDGEGCPP